MDKLVQLAVLHAEFESLHPFLDGNGRLGRMFIPLYMFQTGLIKSPMFYISAYFERNRDEYYERLRAVSGEDDWTGWSLFFLNAIKNQAEENQSKAEKILNLYEVMKRKIVELTKSQYSIHALDWMFNSPIFKSSDFSQNAGIPPATAKRILTVLKSDGMVRELVESSGRRSSVIIFPQLLNIAEGYKAF